jgi:hypothetical protein
VLCLDIHLIIINQYVAKIMVFLLSHRPLTFVIGLGVSSAFATHAIYRMRSSPMLCEPASAQVKDAFTTYERDAKMPVVKDGRVNTAAYKQISSGSLLGMQLLFTDVSAYH